LLLSFAIPLSTTATAAAATTTVTSPRFRSDRADTCGTSPKILTITSRGMISRDLAPRWDSAIIGGTNGELLVISEREREREREREQIS
jgi:hypothetical protein